MNTPPYWVPDEYMRAADGSIWESLGGGRWAPLDDTNTSVTALDLATATPIPVGAW